MKTYQRLASLVDARLRSIERDNREWIQRHKASIERLVREGLPSGSGIDNGVTLDLDLSHGEKLVFNTAFHHMDENGYYDGWTHHTVTVKPSLTSGILVSVGGRNRNDIKEHIRDAFDAALDCEEPIFEDSTTPEVARS